jgi:hypothetical protein
MSIKKLSNDYARRIGMLVERGQPQHIPAVGTAEFIEESVRTVGHTAEI